MNPFSGTLESIQEVEAERPSFVAIYPSGHHLYATNEVGSFEGKTGAIMAFSIDEKTGELTFLNKKSSLG
jgi:6-phosphogluconolactonase